MALDRDHAVFPHVLMRLAFVPRAYLIRTLFSAGRASPKLRGVIQAERRSLVQEDALVLVADSQLVSFYHELYIRFIRN